MTTDFSTTAFTTLTHFIGQNPLFSSLNPTELHELAESAQRKSVPKYHYIYASNEASKWIYLLMSGSVKVASHSEFGREVIKTVIQPGGIFGELSLTGEKRRGDISSSLKFESTFLQFPADKIQQLMQRNFEFCRSVLEFIGSRLRVAEKQLENLIIKDARTRIVEFLHTGAVETGRTVGLETLVKHPFTHQDMAAITGTSRQMVTAVMNDLKRSNQIHFNRHSYLVRDMARLA